MIVVIQLRKVLLKAMKNFIEEATMEEQIKRSIRNLQKAISRCLIDNLRHRFFESKWILKRKVRILKNTIRRAIVNGLLGRELIVVTYVTPQCNQVELIDNNRRITYGKWSYRKLNQNTIKLNR